MPSRNSLKNPKIVVIGSGLAGLTSAYRLHQQGLDIEIYEARKRVGGRVFSAYLRDQIVELGGQNITDGGEAVHLHRLIREFNLKLTGGSVQLDHNYVHQNALTFIPSLLREKPFDSSLLKKRLEDLARCSSNLKEVLGALFPENDPLYNLMAVRLAAYEGAPPEKLSPFYIETLYHMLLGGICSAHQGTGEGDPSIEVFSIQGGNSLLIQKMAQSLNHRLHLNHPLTQVAKDASGTYHLTFQSGQKITADILILAIPCSVYSKIAFDERTIDRSRLQAIQNIPYGTNAKIIVPIQDTPFERRSFMDDQMIGIIHHNRSHLTLYYTGESGYFSDKTLSSTYQHSRKTMEIGLGRHCPSYLTPIMAKDELFAKYDAPLGYSWPNDPYAGGSYAYVAPGQEKLFTDLQEEKGEWVKSLFAPIEGRLYFAGEHTSTLLDVPGTMEAACESGERTARMILQVLE